MNIVHNEIMTLVEDNENRKWEVQKYFFWKKNHFKAPKNR